MYWYVHKFSYRVENFLESINGNVFRVRNVMYYSVVYAMKRKVEFYIKNFL